jgi:hypothetical protein
MWIRRHRNLLPRTGQTTSYPAGDATDRDDGHYRAGWPPSGRFVAMADGTVYDRAASLYWIAAPAQLGGVWGSGGTPTAMTWLDALAAIAALNAGGGYGGFADWRLPNVHELFSLVKEANTYTRIDTSVFVCARNYYWSSTTWDLLTTRAHAVNFDGGSGTVAFAALKTTTYYARPVRGGWLYV